MVRQERESAGVGNAEAGSTWKLQEQGKSEWTELRKLRSDEIFQGNSFIKSNVCKVWNLEVISFGGYGYDECSDKG